MLARSPAALKKARYRARQRDGVIVLQIEIGEHALAEAMIESERLSERDALDRAKLVGAVELVLSEWCARWRKR
jgi:hypothetical protein